MKRLLSAAATSVIVGCFMAVIPSLPAAADCVWTGCGSGGDGGSTPGDQGGEPNIPNPNNPGTPGTGTGSGGGAGDNATRVCSAVKSGTLTMDSARSGNWLSDSEQMLGSGGVFVDPVWGKKWPIFAQITRTDYRWESNGAGVGVGAAVCQTPPGKPAPTFVGLGARASITKVDLQCLYHQDGRIDGAYDRAGELITGPDGKATPAVDLAPTSQTKDPFLHREASIYEWVSAQNALATQGSTSNTLSIATAPAGLKRGECERTYGRGSYSNIEKLVKASATFGRFVGFIESSSVATVRAVVSQEAFLRDFNGGIAKSGLVSAKTQNGRLDGGWTLSCDGFKYYGLDANGDIPWKDFSPDYYLLDCGQGDASAAPALWCDAPLTPAYVIDLPGSEGKPIEVSTNGTVETRAGAKNNASWFRPSIEHNRGVERRGKDEFWTTRWVYDSQTSSPRLNPDIWKREGINSKQQPYAVFKPDTETNVQLGQWTSFIPGPQGLPRTYDTEPVRSLDIFFYDAATVSDKSTLNSWKVRPVYTFGVKARVKLSVPSGVSIGNDGGISFLYKTVWSDPRIFYGTCAARNTSLSPLRVVSGDFGGGFR